MKSFLCGFFLLSGMTVWAQDQDGVSESVEQLQEKRLEETAPVSREPLQKEEPVKITEEGGALLDQIDKLNQVSSHSGVGGYTYSPAGRRSPFQRPSGVQVKSQDGSEKTSGTGLEGYDAGSFKLTSVLWNVNTPKALLRGQGGKVYEVQKGVRIGRLDGYVAEIREGEVLIVERSQGSQGYQTHVLKIGR